VHTTENKLITTITTQKGKTNMTSLFNTDYAEIKVTQTMLDKHIIDANKSVIKLFDDTYDNLENGDGVDFKGEFFSSYFMNESPPNFYDNVISVIRCYKAKTRGDKRISISGLKKYAEAGDVMGIFKRIDEPQYHNRTPFSIVKLSAWDNVIGGMQDLKNALADDGLIKSDEPD
jgi:hypothetical protein